NEKKLRSDLADVIKLNTQLTEGINYMRERAVNAEIDAKSLKAKNVALDGQLHELSREVVRLKASGAGAGGAARPQSASGRNPPPEHVEGLVKRIDGKYVELTIGSDSGLQRGHTMYVFGLENNVGYRGEIRLVEVSPKSAVGQVIGKEVSRIRVNDTVASEILPRR